MVSRKSKTIIGFFVLGAITLVCSLMIILGSITFTKNATYFVLYFNASLRGLTVGASVYFNGVHVGKVVSMEIAASDNNTHFDTPVIIELSSPKGQVGVPDDSELLHSMQDDIDVDDLIENGLRAKLSTSSFITGLLVIDLVMDPHAPPVDISKLTPYRGCPQIPTMESGIDSLVSSFSKLPIHELVNSSMTLLTTINKTLEDMQLGTLSKNINEIMASLHKNIDPLLANANNTLTNMNQTLTTLNTSVTTLSNSLKPSIDILDDTLKSASTTMLSITEMADLVSDLIDERSATMQEFMNTLEAIRYAAISISELANELERQPNSLIFGRQ